jgi:glyoxylase-like metal-dependent hydrolase (beta-lactamase superfamily II)
MDMVKMSRRALLGHGSVVLTGLALPWVARGQGARARNTVTVLTEGYVQAIEGRQLIPGTTPGGARRVASTVALIQGESAIVVADPGMVTDRGLIVDPLKKAGVSPQDVTHIFISHHHPDHTMNMALFPNAEVVDFYSNASKESGVLGSPAASRDGRFCRGERPELFCCITVGDVQGGYVA